MVRTSTVMEELSIGISHASIGELMAQKWNFPDYLVDLIKSHHSPLSSKVDRDIIYTSYLANMLCGIESGKYNFYYIEEDVLERFNLNDPEKLSRYHATLKMAYENQQNM